MIPREIKTDAEPTTRELLEDIRDVLNAILAALEARTAPISRSSDERYAKYAPLLEALAAALGEVDVPFLSSEVPAQARSDHDLAEVLQNFGLRTPSGIGARFRELNGRWIGALRLIRDGEAWRLERRT